MDRLLNRAFDRSTVRGICRIHCELANTLLLVRTLRAKDYTSNDRNDGYLPVLSRSPKNEGTMKYFFDRLVTVLFDENGMALVQFGDGHRALIRSTSLTNEPR